MAGWRCLKYAWWRMTLRTCCTLAACANRVFTSILRNHVIQSLTSASTAGHRKCVHIHTSVSIGCAACAWNIPIVLSQRVSFQTSDICTCMYINGTRASIRMDMHVHTSCMYYLLIFYTCHTLLPAPPTPTPDHSQRSNFLLLKLLYFVYCQVERLCVPGVRGWLWRLWKHWLS